MSTLVENVAKVTAAHAALKDAIAAKGVVVPEGTKLSGMPALVSQIETPPVPTNDRAVFMFDKSTSLIVPNMLVVNLGDLFDMSRLFFQCTSLKSITFQDGFGKNAKDLSNCFGSCSSLTSLVLPDVFGQNATNLTHCFSTCQSLTSLELPDGFGKNATSLKTCFFKCSSLTTLNLPDGFGKNATSLDNCFWQCSSLTTLNLPDGFGKNATSLSSLFSECNSLTTITGNPNFKVSIDLSPCPNLTHDSLMVVINGLQTITTTKKLTLGATNLAKLTDEEKKVATDKGWTLA